MKIRKSKSIFFQNAFVLSIIAHGIGIFVLAYWTFENEIPKPILEPIQIKTIIYEPSSKPKVKKASPLKPVKELPSKFDRPIPSLTPVIQEIKQIQPIAKSAAYTSNQRVSLTIHDPKPVEPFMAHASKPAFFQTGMVASMQPLSVQPVHMVERVGPTGNSLQRVKIVKLSDRFSAATVPNSSFGARIISNKGSLHTVSVKPIQEVKRIIRAASINQVQPAQFASISSDLADASKQREFEARLEPSANSRESEVRDDSSDIDLESLRKGFSTGVWKKIAKAKYYPRIAQNRGWEGKPVIEFQLGKDGNLLGYSIAVASPYEVLNQAASDAVKNASPYPKIPESFKLNSISLKLPISFKMD